ncbi:hypothetical protein SADUNF_Sadunf05G0082200 [Salix dunnii]|uniref:Uncharacterized protein n=1 Tax=Salix dunnii TaxID=1413687 RepID=A0A835K7G7_9ROSI|nr:hypothetical protein SADUNF_Sadunf05G0082200 [Salix dunnii]
MDADNHKYQPARKGPSKTLFFYNSYLEAITASIFPANRGIDPLTHRPINESAIDSMSTSLGAVLGEEITSGFGCKNQKNPDGEKCQELNLELRICPPYQHPIHSMEGIGRKITCFYCILGLRSSKDCSCGNDSDDLLALKNGALDY